MTTRVTLKTGPGKGMLLAVLDTNRSIMVWKVAGPWSEQATRPAVASGTSLLGMVKHLASVEHWWFYDFFAGNDVEYP